jgi:hypothetical protein
VRGILRIIMIFVLIVWTCSTFYPPIAGVVQHKFSYDADLEGSDLD